MLFHSLLIYSFLLNTLERSVRRWRTDLNILLFQLEHHGRQGPCTTVLTHHSDLIKEDVGARRSLRYDVKSRSRPTHPIIDSFHVLRYIPAHGCQFIAHHLELGL